MRRTITSRIFGQQAAHGVPAVLYRGVELLPIAAAARWSQPREQRGGGRSVKVRLRIETTETDTRRGNSKEIKLSKAR